jgi:glutathione synthase/RimK-type ligase-like ATP-grasp enzyme
MKGGTPSVVLLTSAELPELAPDDQLLATAYRTAGWTVTVLPWQESPPQSDLAIVRSCWDYAEQPLAFLAALDRIAERMPLWNPMATIRWNLDKRYLLELAQAGVQVPPTRVFTSAERPALAALCDRLATDELVIKPVVGAGGVDTWRMHRTDEHRWADMPEDRLLLAQPFLAEVLTAGEVSLTFLDGAYSHAVVKHAAAGEFRVQEEHGGVVAPWTPSPALIATATEAVAAIPHPWRYARVDGILTAAGFRLMELELVEPELFFRYHEGAADRFVGLTRG